MRKKKTFYSKIFISAFIKSGVSGKIEYESIQFFFNNFYKILIL